MLSSPALSGFRRTLELWLLVAAVATGIRLGAAPLMDPDEGRNGEVGREMAATNNYVVPHLNGMPYLDKPVLYFAAEALAMEVLGPTELAARLPAFVFTLLTAALLFAFARRRWGIEPALIASIAFLSMPMTIAFARTVIFDSMLTFFMTLAILSFHEAIERKERKWATIAWAAIALGILTKGPVAIAVPLLAAIPYAIWRRSFRWLWSFGALILFAAIVTPWVWAMQMALPDFLQYALVTETAARLTTGEMKRTGPFWYFVPYLIVGAFPWSIAVASSWRNEWRQEPRAMFLLIWIGAPFLFFSLSQSKLPQYILPLMPAVALLCGHAWPALRARVAAAALALFGVVLMIAPLTRQFTKDMNPIVAGPARTAAWVLGLMFVAGAMGTWFVRRREGIIVALSLPLLAVPVITAPVMNAIGERRSARSFIRQMAGHLQSGAQVIGVEAFTGSMAFYSRRQMTIVSPDATEYTSNYLVRRYERFRDAPRSTLRSVSWFERDLGQCCRRRIYVLRRQDRHYQEMMQARGLPRIAEGAHHVAYGPYEGR